MRRVLVVSLCLAFLGSYAKAQDTNGWSFKRTVGNQSAQTFSRMVTDTATEGTHSQAFYFNLPETTSVEWQKRYKEGITTPTGFNFQMRLNQFGIGEYQSVRFEFYLSQDDGSLFRIQGGLITLTEMGWWWDSGVGTSTYGTPPQTFSGIVLKFHFNPSTAHGYAELMFDDLRLVYCRPLVADSVVSLDRFGDAEILPPPPPPPLVPIPSISPNSVNFGDVAVGSRKSGVVWVKNKGNAALTINTVSSNNTAFVPTLQKSTVQPGDSSKISVTFEPKAQGTANGNIAVVCSNAGTQSVEASGTGITVSDVEETRNQPKGFELRQNYPNPFNPTTTIEISLPKPAFVNLTVYNASGQEVTTLATGKLSEGLHQLTWDASRCPSGTYFARFETDGFVVTRRMLLLK